jgi:hypothetical protein
MKRPGSPDRLGLEDVRAFQIHLVATGMSWPALNQIVCALRFFYGVTLGHAVIPERIAYAREPLKLHRIDVGYSVMRWHFARNRWHADSPNVGGRRMLVNEATGVKTAPAAAIQRPSRAPLPQPPRPHKTHGR